MARSRVKTLLVAVPGKLPEHIRKLILQLDKRCFPSDTRCEASDSYWWFLYVGRRLAGYASLSTREEASGIGYLYRAGVLHAFRGRGLQRRLIQARVKHARRLGLKQLITYTSRSNLASANSLISCGFRLYMPAYRWGFEDALYFNKVL